MTGNDNKDKEVDLKLDEQPFVVELVEVDDGKSDKNAKKPDEKAIKEAAIESAKKLEAANAAKAEAAAKEEKAMKEAQEALRIEKLKAEEAFNKAKAEQDAKLSQNFAAAFGNSDSTADKTASGVRPLTLSAMEAESQAELSKTTSKPLGFADPDLTPVASGTSATHLTIELEEIDDEPVDLTGSKDKKSSKDNKDNNEASKANVAKDNNEKDASKGKNKKKAPEAVEAPKQPKDYGDAIELDLKDIPIRDISDDVLFDISEMKENLAHDKRKKKILIAAVIAFLGQFFPFWGVYTSAAGISSMGSLFGGYGGYSLIGKLYFVASVVLIGFILINLKRYMVIPAIVGLVSILAQIVMIEVKSSSTLDYISGLVVVIPWIGLILVAGGMIYTTLVANKLRKEYIAKQRVIKGKNV